MSKTTILDRWRNDSRLITEALKKEEKKSVSLENTLEEFRKLGVKVNEGRSTEDETTDKE